MNISRAVRCILTNLKVRNRFLISVPMRMSRILPDSSDSNSSKSRFLGSVWFSNFERSANVNFQIRNMIILNLRRKFVKMKGVLVFALLSWNVNKFSRIFFNFSTSTAFVILEKSSNRKKVLHFVPWMLTNLEDFFSTNFRCVKVRIRMKKRISGISELLKVFGY